MEPSLQSQFHLTPKCMPFTTILYSLLLDTINEINYWTFMRPIIKSSSRARACFSCYVWVLYTQIIPTIYINSHIKFYLHPMKTGPISAHYKVPKPGHQTSECFHLVLFCFKLLLVTENLLLCFSFLC